MKHVSVYQNGFDVGAEMVAVQNSWTDFLNVISQKFNIKAERIFTKEGEEIDELELIRNGETLCVSTGEAFKKPKPVNMECDSKLQNYELAVSKYLDIVKEISNKLDSFAKAQGYTIYREIAAKKKDEASGAAKLEDMGANDSLDLKKKSQTVNLYSSENKRMKWEIAMPPQPEQKISEHTNEKRWNNQDDNPKLSAARTHSHTKSQKRNSCGPEEPQIKISAIQWVQ